MNFYNLYKTFRLFGHPKVPDPVLIGMGKTPHPTPRTLHPAPNNQLFQQTLVTEEKVE